MADSEQIATEERQRQQDQQPAAGQSQGESEPKQAAAFAQSAMLPQLMQPPFPSGAVYQQFIPPPTPEVSRAWHIAKMVLAGSSIVTCVIAIAIGGALVGAYTGFFDGPIDFISVVIVAGGAFVWNIAEFITICVRRGKRGIHPGAHVGLHLVLWLAAATVSGILGTMVSFDTECDAYCQEGYPVDDGPDEPDTDTASSYDGSVVNTAQYQAATRLEEALLGFMLILFIIEFVLFVRACIETHQRNKAAAAAARAVYMLPAGGYYVPLGGPQQPQSEQQQQQQFVPMMPQPPANAAVAPETQQQQQLNPTVYGYYAPAGAQMWPQPNPPMQQAARPAPIPAPGRNAQSSSQAAATSSGADPSGEDGATGPGTAI